MTNDLTTAILFIGKEPRSGSRIPTRNLPLMLEPVLFAPPAKWCCVSLRQMGVSRFLVVVRQPEHMDAAKACFPEDTTFLLASQEDAQDRMNEFLEDTEGRLVIFTKPVLFYYQVANVLMEYTPPPGGECDHGAYLVSALDLAEAMQGMDMGEALEEVGGSLDRFVTPLFDDSPGRLFANEHTKEIINEWWMDNGVTILDRHSTYIGCDVSIEPGAVILPGTILRGQTHIGAFCEIGPHAVLTDAIVGDYAVVNASQCVQCTIGHHTTVGPFAYLRPGTEVGPHVRVGDFVELKNSTIGEGAKIAHLAYLGDSDVGARTDIGCGTVTVNFDGEKKFRTQIGEGAFIGCNTNLVAPVTVGDGSYVAAGSTITRDVPSESLAIARAQQVTKNKWVQKHKKDD